MHTIEGLEDRGEGDSVYLHKLLGQLQFLFCVNILSDMLEFAVLEIGEVISGRKSFTSAAKSVGKQTLGEQLGEGSSRGSK